MAAPLIDVGNPVQRSRVRNVAKPVPGRVLGDEVGHVFWVVYDSKLA